MFPISRKILFFSIVCLVALFLLMVNLVLPHVQIIIWFKLKKFKSMKVYCIHNSLRQNQYNQKPTVTKDILTFLLSEQQTVILIVIIMITALNSKTKVISLHSYNKSLVDKCSNSIFQSLISEDSSPNPSVNPSLCNGEDDNVMCPHRANVNTN